ncbi:ABC transporter ATP-binding protein [Streptomyces sp. NPDC057718]|uniref:ABC transporter ATP-binding protein n=1 Tax=Streptomyces sp. NPDC057718 TaxID=3346225 RepID=UPI0036B7E063
MTLLSIRDLSVTYRRANRPAVTGVDLDIARGRTVGVVGESGSGKSTIGSAIVGLAPVGTGRIVFDGTDITHATNPQRRQLSRRIQMIFQDPYGSLNPARTIGDTIGEGLLYAHGMTSLDVTERVATALREVGLPEQAAERYPADFSGGQRQRIAIARAIIGNPDLIVCDEPVSALDLSVQAQVLNLLARLRADHGLSYLFVSHDLSVVRYLCDEIVVLYAGQVMERGPAHSVATTPAHPYTQALLAAAPVPDPQQQARRRAERRSLTRPVQADARALGEHGCPFVARCPRATQRCRESPPHATVLVPGHTAACHHLATASRTNVGPEEEGLPS